MRNPRVLKFGLALATLFGLGMIGRVQLPAASAQDEAARAIRLPGGPVSIAASGDFVYVMRGNMIYQIKAADLSVANQKELPMEKAGDN
jgi:hypothetical protein